MIVRYVEITNSKNNTLAIGYPFVFTDALVLDPLIFCDALFVTRLTRGAVSPSIGREASVGSSAKLRMFRSREREDG